MHRTAETIRGVRTTTIRPARWWRDPHGRLLLPGWVPDRHTERIVGGLLLLASALLLCLGR